MAADAEFFLRLYNASSLLLRHQYRQGQPVRHWHVLVICPSRDLGVLSYLAAPMCLITKS